MKKVELSAQEITIKIPALAKSAILVDRHNNRRAIEAKNGFYELVLPGATNRAGWPTLDDPKAKALGEPENLVGGATQLVIENVQELK